MKENLIEELKQYLREDSKMLGSVFKEYESGKISPKELVSAGVAANTGSAYNNIQIIKAILEEKIPTSASISLYAYRAIKRILQRPKINEELVKYLNKINESLFEQANSESAIKLDQIELENIDKVLSLKAEEIKIGIYVYSFPTYLRVGTVEDPERFWLKIGSTQQGIWKRIVEQNRQTSMPEDPKLLRIYHSEIFTADQVEKKFHNVLDKIGHERSSAVFTKSGKEWFATTLDALDALAELMDLKIEKVTESYI
jgi:hypothetical protein